MSSGEPVRLTREQVREIDRLAVERYHMPSILLMEEAARWVWASVVAMLRGRKGPVVVVCGGGNNGGDGFAAARLLHKQGINARVLLTVDDAAFRGDALVEWKMLQAFGVPVQRADPPTIANATALVIVDAIFGTGLNRAPDAQTASIIEAMNQRSGSVLSVDVPSGLDCNTGEPYGACVSAIQTITFVAEKAGFANPASKQYTGEITVGDIGVPRELIDEVAKMSPR